MAVEAKPTVKVPDDELCWGDTWLPLVLEAIGGFDGKVYGIRLHAEYGEFATATILHGAGSELTRQLPHHGTVWLSEALPFGVPRGIQAVTVDIEQGSFVIVNCRYAPIDTPISSLIAALQVKDDSNQAS